MTTTERAQAAYDALLTASDDALWAAVKAIRDQLPGREELWVDVTLETEREG